ncbi:hypothetical protein BJF79_07390 [Actinomadura sp. CNU-125]|uniref:hypothetical protein n=1 Tax=Actinomadura sp. CNU-125 TaxID=1904961 RepID=UPI000959EF3B|nr:hypothetical protein [Actinomadura sp. CNU-125]OLT34382.1 hypothetical protein BJF79_07390 [Actinomadura sp. CNU-125]
MNLQLDYIPQTTDLIACAVCGETYPFGIMVKIPGLGHVDDFCIDREIKTLVGATCQPSTPGAKAA